MVDLVGVRSLVEVSGYHGSLETSERFAPPHNASQVDPDRSVRVGVDVLVMEPAVPQNETQSKAPCMQSSILSLL